METTVEDYKQQENELNNSLTKAKSSETYIKEHQKEHQLYLRLGKELEELEEQKKTLDKYRNEKIELESDKSKFTLNKKHHLEQKQNLNEAITQEQQDIKNKEASIVELYKCIELLDNSIDEYQRDFNIVSEGSNNLNNLKTRAENLYRQISASHTKILNEKERIGSIELMEEDKVKQLEVDAEQQTKLEQSLHDKEKQQGILKLQIENKKQENATNNKSLEEIGESLDEAMKQKERLESELEELQSAKLFVEKNKGDYLKYNSTKTEIVELEKQKSELVKQQSAKNEAENNKKNLMVRRESNVSRKVSVETERDKLKKEYQEKNSTVKTYQKRFEGVSANIEKITTLHQQIEEALRIVNDDGSNKKYLLNTLEQKLKDVQEVKDKLNQSSSLIDEEKEKELKDKFKLKENLQSRLVELEKQLEVNSSKIVSKTEMNEKIKANKCPIFDTECPLSQEQDLTYTLKEVISTLKIQQGELEQEREAITDKLSSLGRIEQDLRDYEDNKSRYKLLQENLSELLKDFRANINAVYEASDVHSTIDSLLDEISTHFNVIEKAVYTDIRAKLKDITNQHNDVISFESAESNIEDALNLIEKDTESVNELYEMMMKIKKSLQETITEQKSQKTRAETELDNLHTRLNEIQELLSEKTKTLDEHSKELEHIDNDIAEQEKQLAQINESYSDDELDRLSKALEEKKAEEDRLRQVYEDYLRKETALTEYPKKEQSLKETSTKIETMKEKKRNAENSLKDIESYIERLEKEKTQIDEDISELRTKLERSQIAKEELKVHQENIAEIESIERQIKQYRADIHENIASHYKEGFDWDSIDAVINDVIQDDNAKQSLINTKNIANELKNIDTESNITIEEARRIIDREVSSLEQIERVMTAFGKDIGEKLADANNKRSTSQSDIQNTKVRIDELHSGLEQKQEQIRSIENELTQIDTQLNQLNNKLDELSENFSENEFNQLEKDISTKKEQKKKLNDIYEKYIREKDVASTIPEKEDKLTTLKGKLRETKDNLRAKKEELDRITEELSKHNLEKYKQELKTKREEEKNLIGIKNRTETELEKLNDDLKIYGKKQVELKHQKNELKKYQSTKKILKKISKDVLDQTSSAISKELVNNISHKADKIYRKIAPQENRRLIWCSDDKEIYTLKLQSRTNPGNVVDVKNLSGGQLMSASLSLRLALISMFPDLGIGFLDEPTIFLDKERKENLARTLTQNLISTYIENKDWIEQLFIITHDESFSNLGTNEVNLKLDKDNFSQVIIS